MITLCDVDNHAAHGIRSDEPAWYNRKQAIQFGRRIYPTKYGHLAEVHFEYIVFCFGGRAIDADGREYPSILEAATHFASLHPEYAKEDTAVGVAFQGSPLGRRSL